MKREELYRLSHQIAEIVHDKIDNAIDSENLLKLVTLAASAVAVGLEVDRRKFLEVCAESYKTAFDIIVDRN